jgi:serpin B
MPETAVKTIVTQPKFVSLSVPKFTVEYKQNLADILKEMGVKKAFQIGSAEFEPMFTHDTMWITSLMHKTYINVDEEGTEAAAVTSVGMAGNSLPPEPIVVKFNKPFSFVICDKANGEVLFVGRFAYGTDK